MVMNEQEKPVERMAYSLITQTPVPYKGRWSNRVFRREYLTHWRNSVKADWKAGKARNVKRTSVIPQPPSNPPANMEICSICNLSYPQTRAHLHRVSNLHKSRMLENFIERYQLLGFDKICSIIDEVIKKENAASTAGLQSSPAQFECKV